MAGRSKSRDSDFSDINDDILQNILGRLPALSFASAACVSKSWNSVCSRVLSRPKLSSALSLNPSLSAAVKEVLDKVLSEPIRPHFAIVNIGAGTSTNLWEIMRHIEKLGSQIPVVIFSSHGIIGRDALTNEIKEVKWNPIDDLEEEMFEGATYGILLTVGYLPGLKVGAIPLPNKGPQAEAIDKFVRDIRDYTASVSGDTSPVGIFLFGEAYVDLISIVDSLDYAMPVETVVVGAGGGDSIYGSANIVQKSSGRSEFYSGTVALVFVEAREKSAGKIQFHVSLSKGVSAIGPRYKAVSVKTRASDHSTWLTAKREGQQEILDGQILLEGVSDELENRVQFEDLYIGVTKHRNFCVGSGRTRPMTFMAFHWISGGDEQYLYVHGTGIRTGDFFQFYVPDPETALSSTGAVSLSLKELKAYDRSSTSSIDGADRMATNLIFGGFIIACAGRGENFDGSSCSAPVSENFPCIPLGGVFCGGEIGRVHKKLIHPGEEDGLANCSTHVYSNVYLLMSYTEHRRDDVS